jgi:Tfp pilus assembly PilM family ATPase
MIERRCIAGSIKENALDKHQLAQALRQRQYRLALLEKHVIDAIPDEEIIDNYITCSDCGEKQVTSQELSIVIGLAANVNQFFELCESIARTRAIFAVAREASPAKARRR